MLVHGGDEGVGPGVSVSVGVGVRVTESVVDRVDGVTVMETDISRENSPADTIAVTAYVPGVSGA